VDFEHFVVNSFYKPTPVPGKPLQPLARSRKPPKKTCPQALPASLRRFVAIPFVLPAGRLGKI
jgi:hypothetical protein